MSVARFVVPFPENEPIKGYLEGSSETEVM